MAFCRQNNYKKKTKIFKSLDFDLSKNQLEREQDRARFNDVILKNAY